MVDADVAQSLVERWFGGWTDDEPLGENDPCMALWWGKSEAVDEELRERFGAAHLEEAADLDAPDLFDDPVRAVARVLLLDQIPRNIYRGTGHMFATDGLARQTTQRIVGNEVLYRSLPRIHRYFVLMPWMHAETVEDHVRGTDGFAALAEDAAGTARANVYGMALEYEHKHRVIVERFGRYPHRNRLLGRESTAEERAFLEQPGSSF